MLQLKMFEGVRSARSGIRTRSKSSRELLAVVSADDDSKQGRDGNDAGFLSLTKFHWSVPICFDKLEFVARGVRRSY